MGALEPLKKALEEMALGKVDLTMAKLRAKDAAQQFSIEQIKRSNTARQEMAKRQNLEQSASAGAVPSDDTLPETVADVSQPAQGGVGASVLSGLLQTGGAGGPQPAAQGGGGQAPTTQRVPGPNAGTQTVVSRTDPFQRIGGRAGAAVNIPLALARLISGNPNLATLERRDVVRNDEAITSAKAELSAFLERNSELSSQGKLDEARKLQTLAKTRDVMKRFGPNIGPEVVRQAHEDSVQTARAREVSQRKAIFEMSESLVADGFSGGDSVEVASAFVQGDYERANAIMSRTKRTSQEIMRLNLEGARRRNRVLLQEERIKAAQAGALEMDLDARVAKFQRGGYLAQIGVAGLPEDVVGMTRTQGVNALEDLTRDGTIDPTRLGGLPTIQRAMMALEGDMVLIRKEGAAQSLNPFSEGDRVLAIPGNKVVEEFAILGGRREVSPERMAQAKTFLEDVGYTFREGPNGLVPDVDPEDPNAVFLTEFLTPVRLHSRLEEQARRAIPASSIQWRDPMEAARPTQQSKPEEDVETPNEPLTARAAGAAARNVIGSAARTSTPGMVASAASSLFEAAMQSRPPLPRAKVFLTEEDRLKDPIIAETTRKREERGKKVRDFVAGLVTGQ
jgi:hypothetical protein